MRTCGCNYPAASGSGSKCSETLGYRGSRQLIGRRTGSQNCSETVGNERATQLTEISRVPPSLSLECPAINRAGTKTYRKAFL